VSLDEKVNKIKELVGAEALTSADKIRNIKHHMLIGENRSKEEVLSSVFMVLIGLTLIIFSVGMEAFYYQAQEIGNWKMKSIFALAAGAMAVGFTGNINIKFHWVQASGSLAVVLLFYFISPWSLENRVSNAQSVEEPGTVGFVPSFFISTSYADGYNQLGSNNFVAEEQQNVGINYEYKLVYPIGVEELKQESFRLKNIIQETEPNKVKVYSLGSIFRAPVNALLYNNNYDISIRHNRLVNKKALDEFEKFISQNLDLTNTNINVYEGTSTDADIVLEINPK
jgi:hypothetical protein